MEPVDFTPIPEEPKKKRPAFLLPLIIAGLCLLIGAICLFLFLNTPKSKVVKGFTKTMETMKPKGAVAAYLDADTLQKSLANGSSQEKLVLTLQDIGIPYNDFTDIAALPLSLSLASKINTEEKKASLALSVLLGTSSVFDSEFYLQNKDLAFSCPEFFDGFLSLETDQLGAQFNSSYLGQEVLQQTLPEDAGFSLFDELRAGEQPQTNLPALYKERYPEDFEIAKKSMRFTKTDSAQIMFADDTVTCPGYLITMPSETAKTLLSHFAEVYDEFYMREMPHTATMTKLAEQMRFEETLSATIFLDKRSGCIARMIVELPFTSQGEALTIHTTVDLLTDPEKDTSFQVQMLFSDSSGQDIAMNLGGSAESKENVSASAFRFTLVDAVLAKDLLTADLASDFNSEDGSLHFTCSFDDPTPLHAEISMEGYFSQVERGKSYTFSIGNLNLSSSTDFSLDLSGEFSLSGLQEEITAPKGESRPLLQMDKEKLMELMREIFSNAPDSTIGRMFL